MIAIDELKIEQYPTDALKAVGVKNLLPPKPAPPSRR